MKKIIRNIIGVILLTIGVIGGAIPILQGWVFVLTGFIVLDFKKKNQYEEKILTIISKVKWGKQLAIFWRNIKNKNKEIIEQEHDEKIRTIYYDINKDIKKGGK